MKRLLPFLVPVGGFFGLLGLGVAVPALSNVLNLALPFFGLIALGYICGKLMDLPEAGLVWMNFFIVYVALPALFFNLISASPIAELANWGFIFSTTISTVAMFALAFGVGLWRNREVGAATISGVAGSYSNIGYMGPGLTLAALGTQSVVPTALIFVADNIFLFSATPFLMGLRGTGQESGWATARLVIKRIITHPFNIATAVGVTAAFFHWQPPASIGKMLSFLQNAAAPCALFVMGVTVALRPTQKMSVEVPVLLLIKLVMHPLIVWAVLSLVGGFSPVWTYTAILMAALPPALNVFVMANQYHVFVERASSVILIGTIVSVMTVTTLLYLIAGSKLPVNLFSLF